MTHAQEERNYHVFYEMLAGLSEPERKKYGLLGAEQYFYLNQAGLGTACNTLPPSLSLSLALAASGGIIG